MVHWKISAHQLRVGQDLVRMNVKEFKATSASIEGKQRPGCLRHYGMLMKLRKLHPQAFLSPEVHLLCGRCEGIKSLIPQRPSFLPASVAPHQHLLHLCAGRVTALGFERHRCKFLHTVQGWHLILGYRRVPKSWRKLRLKHKVHFSSGGWWPGTMGKACLDAKGSTESQTSKNYILYYLSWEPNAKLTCGRWSPKPLTTEGSSNYTCTHCYWDDWAVLKCSTAQISEDKKGKK